MKAALPPPLLLLPLLWCGEDRAVAAAPDSMLHEVWSPTSDSCSLSAAPATAAFKVSVDRTVDLRELTEMGVSLSRVATLCPVPIPIAA